MRTRKAWPGAAGDGPGVKTSLAGGKLISWCPCPLSSLRAPVVKHTCHEPLGQPGRKKRNPRQVSQRVQTSKGVQSAVDMGGGAGLPREGDLWPWCTSRGSASLALRASVTSFTCDLLEPWPSRSTGGLLNPAPGPSPEEHVAWE